MKHLLLLLSVLIFAGCASGPGPAGDKKPEPKVQSDRLLPGVYGEKAGNMVKVTWVYENPEATSVGLVGSFQSWNTNAAIPFISDGMGAWHLTISTKPDTVILYKFWVDGQWVEDPNAPSSISDGFGGSNGRVLVKDLVSGQ